MAEQLVLPLEALVNQAFRGHRFQVVPPAADRSRTLPPNFLLLVVSNLLRTVTVVASYEAQNFPNWSMLIVYFKPFLLMIIRWGITYLLT